MDYLLGIELGTTRLKTGLYSTLGSKINECVSAYPLNFDKMSGKAESDPIDWWHAVIKTLKSITSKIDPTKIKAICVGSHGPSLVALDRADKISCPSILWMDSRAKCEAEFISQKLNLKVNDVAWFVPKALWLKNNHPSIFENVSTLFQPLDYINYCLTGIKRTVIVSDFVKIWDEQILLVSELSENLFPKQIKIGEILGTITSETALITGLAEGTPVTAGTGGADCFEVLISTGAMSKGIVCDRGGTSQGINLCWDEKFNDKNFFEAPHPFVNGCFHIGGLMGTTGKSLQWYKELYYGIKEPYESLFKDAAHAKAGSKKLIFLPYLAGERTPWWDNKARGVFFGLSLDHNKCDIARSILEGVGYGLNHILNLFRNYGVSISEIRSCGGQSLSPLWNQIKADISGVKVVTNKVIDGSTLGLAIIAGVGIGIYPNVKEASEQIIKIDKVYIPSEKNHKLYSELQEIYESLYPSLKNNFAKLKTIEYT